VDFSLQAYHYDLSKATKAQAEASKYGQLAAPTLPAPAS